jgi:hypothetical protein
MVPRYPLAHESPSFVSVNNNSTAFTVQYADGTGMFNVFLFLQLHYLRRWFQPHLDLLLENPSSFQT